MSENWFQENGPPSGLPYLVDEVFLSQYCTRFDCKNGVDTLILGGTHSHENMSY